MTEAQIAELPIEERHQLADELAQKISLDSQKSYSKAEIEELFTFFRLASSIGDHQNGGKVFQALQPILHRFFDEGNDPETAIDFLIEWSLLAISITTERTDRFVSMPVYLDLLDVLDNAPEEFQYKRGRVILQLSLHFQQWREKGGVDDDLADEDLSLLEDAVEMAEEMMDEFLNTAEEKGKYDEVLQGHRALFRYYLNVQKPNDAVAQMKAIIQTLPQTTDYHPSQTAEAQILLGQLFSQFKKWQTALKYFTMAKEQFEELGEEYEMNMFQAEGWMEECEKHL